MFELQVNLHVIKGHIYDDILDLDSSIAHNCDFVQLKSHAFSTNVKRIINVSALAGN